MKSVKGRNEGKDEEIKGEAFGHLKWGKKRSKVPKCEDQCSLEELRE